ncbi:hypothetical protein V22_23140 [Calycomorphotria hydatis]|uniref:Uncharacterized protein n=1 Tax=Calycomorphotria hydatis TaxID=2528027 RepID=A0A517T9M4_9PLAN|nr:hypothetical protein V22_23140 [Calycomorphotria hydatis]
MNEQNIPVFFGEVTGHSIVLVLRIVPPTDAYPLMNPPR